MPSTQLSSRLVLFTLSQSHIHPSSHTPAVIICICNCLFLLIPTSFGSHEQQRLRKGSFALDVKHAHSQVIVGVWSEITDQLFLFAGPSLHHDRALWLPGPSGMVVYPGALSGQVDLEPEHELEYKHLKQVCVVTIMIFLFCGIIKISKLYENRS